MNVKFSLPLIAIALALAGCPNREAQREAKIQQSMLQDQVARVTFVTPTIENVNETMEISGAFEALNQVQLGAKIAGRITGISVSDGSPVRAGQVIATIDTSTLQEQVRQAQASVDAALSAKTQAQTQASMSPLQSQAAVRQAEAALKAAKANLDKVRSGPREQEKEAAKQKVNATKSAMNKAKTDLERYKRLYEQDAVSKAEVDAAQLTYDTALSEYQTAVEMLDMALQGSRPEEIAQAEASVHQAEEQLQNAKAATMIDAVRRQQVAQAEAQLREARARLAQANQAILDARIVSPVDGYVSGKPAQVGQVVNIGTPVATVVSLSSVYLEGQISEKDIRNVATGQRCEIKVDAFPTRVFQGTVVAINPVADSLGRLFSARIAVNDPERKLRPGMFARGSLITRTVRDAVMLPVDAILTQDSKKYVFVAQGDTAHKVEVQTGVDEDGKIQVINLSPNEKVILKGKDLLTDGAKIAEDKPQGGN